MEGDVTSQGSPEVFQHVRVVIGIVLGLGVARLLNGVARFVQHPQENRVYLVHLGWVLTLLLTLVHFWWWELDLLAVTRWTFELYLFVVVYAILLFLLCDLLLPDNIREYSGYEEYFISRRRWFFGIFALTVLFDVIDTWVKGRTHFARFAIEYLFRVPVYLILCAIAAWTSDRRFHGAFVIASLVYEVSWIVRLLNTIG